MKTQDMIKWAAKETKRSQQIQSRYLQYCESKYRWWNPWTWPLKNATKAMSDYPY